MVANVKDKAVIVGVANTAFSKDSGVSELSLAAQAVKGAIDDAGLKSPAQSAVVISHSGAALTTAAALRRVACTRR